MIRAAKAHQVRSARMIAREAHCLHHGFGAGHMERYFVKPRDFPQTLHIVGNYGMVRPEHRPKIADTVESFRDVPLVEVISKQIDSIRSCEIVKSIAVQVGNRYAGRGLQECSRSQVCLDQTAILERYTIEVGELEIRYPVDDLGRMPNGFCKARLIKGREPHEACAPATRDTIRRHTGRDAG